MNFPLPFVLLALSIALVWLPAVPVGDRRLPPWTLVFAAACIAGAVASPSVLQVPALVALAALAMLAWAGTGAPRSRCPITVAAAVLALAMSLHLLPGFHPVMLYQGLRLTPDAAPFALGLGFDKAAAGLLLLAAFSVRVTSWRQLAS